jgi:hypothetical protein
MRCSFYIFLLISFLSNAQIERSILNTAGRSAKNLNFSINQQKRIDYSIGEPVTFTQLANGKRINNGFIQPSTLIPISSGGSNNYASTALVANVFPNPNDGSFTIAINSKPLEYYNVQLIDARGRLVSVFKMENETLRITQLELPTGIYYLNFYDSIGSFLLQKNISIL